MTLVMGQRNRLSWDIPAADSFLLNQAIYRLSDADYQGTLKELDELLELAPIMRKPVRNLSLGERMKCELAAGLLHRPQVLFLDEPTIGLDITAQARIRDFLQEYNRRTGATILLTSHYMADVTALCERIIIIHHGQLKYDGGIGDLSRRIAPFKLIGVVPGRPCAVRPELLRHGPCRMSDDDGKQLRPGAGRRRGRHHRPHAGRSARARPDHRRPAHRGRDRTAPFSEARGRHARISTRRFWQVNWAEQWQYRANLLMYLLYLARLAHRLPGRLDHHRQQPGQRQRPDRQRLHHLLPDAADRRPAHQRDHHPYPGL